MLPDFSLTGRKLTARSGILELMDDLGQAMTERPEMLMLGGGNPAAVPAIQALWRRRMQELLEQEKNDPRSREAVDLFCYQAKKFIGAYAAVLGGLDTLAFSGGIGERAATVRWRICEGLSFLGLELDAKRNSENAPVISSEKSRATVRVIKTDEESQIAQSVRRVLQ